MTTDMEALIEGVKLDARNLMRSDPRVWHEALESALDKLLPAFWEASRAPQPTEAEWSCEQGCKAPSAVCLLDHQPAPQPPEDDADLPDPLQRIYWYSCDCDVRTRYCEEHHRRSITVGELLARRAPAEPAEDEPLNIERENAAAEYTRRNVGGMQPVMTVGERVHDAFVSGAEWAAGFRRAPAEPAVTQSPDLGQATNERSER